ncbi:hypothetical protein HYH02_003500 [Chlamydomonas schloesseri]|uniref:C2 domain-containing protein n=1 Tax=Chlamydomonas schloesseri TaxID=2026947 RepID=A0A835WQA4_9CHLO|nr:hypothetical protein HYH02_003500 [Chlamydomonas schloesseri]|eukprot:KAG2451720.1 hypothetical protein HYH02_003500 [Chlamydomonas schloesseri]
MAAPPPPYQGIQMPAFPAGLPPPSFPPPAGGFYQAQPVGAQAATAPEQALAQMQLQQQQMQIIQEPPAEAPPAAPAEQQTAATTRLEENRPPPLNTNPTPVRRGLFNFFRRGNATDASQQQQQQQQQGPGQQQQPGATGGAPDPNDPDAAAAQLGPSASRAGSQAGSQGGAAGAGTEGGAGGAPGAGAGQPQGPGIMQKEERDALQVAMVSYDNSYKLQEEAPAVTAAVILHFDTGRITGAPAPLPSRLTAQHEGRFAREELGLYREDQCVLSENSLNKTEQRIAKAATLDRALLAEMAGGNAAAGEQQVAIMAQRQAARAQEVQVQQLQVGALPTLTEEEEKPEAAEAPGPQGQLPPGAASPPQGGQQQQPPQAPMTPGGPMLPMPPGPGGSPPVMAAAQLPLSPGAEAEAIAAAGGALTPEQQAALQQQQQQQQQQQLAAQGLLPPGAQAGDPAAMAAMAAVGGGGGGDPIAAAMAMAAAAAGAPSAPAIQDPLFAYQWLDENGLMVYVPNPIKRDKERPARRYDQDKEMTRTYVRRPVVEAVAGAGGRGGGARGSEARLYRLDIELGRLEFGVHPAMSQEDLLAARLMALFREFKKREAVGLVLFYAARLAALEDSLLGAREKLFALQATEAAADDVLDAYALLGKIEREVAELRQLKEEEEALLTRTVRAMERQFEALRAVRQQQGYALTNLELTVLTKPPLEMSWKQGVLTRERLDVLLVAAELEDIAGLPRFPDPLPVPDLADLPLPRLNAAGAPMGAGGPGGLGPGFLGAPGAFGAYGALVPGGQAAAAAAAAMAAGEAYTFRLRRVESMCAAHSALLAEAVARLDALKNRPSADPEDPVLKALEEQVALLGRAPRRVAMMAEDALELQRRATEMVKAGQVFVSRLPHLVPVLTINPTGPAGAGLPPAAQQQLALMQQQGQQPGQQQQQQMVMTPQGMMPAPGQQPQGPGQQPPGQQPWQQQQPKTVGKQGSKGRYYIKLFVNHKFVDQSDVATLAENFSGDFKDLFSVQVSHFPESILVQLFERHALRDYFVAQVYVAVPGVSGTPHVDATPRPYQFTSLTAFRTRNATNNPNGGGLSGAMPLMSADAGGGAGAGGGPGAFATVFPAGTLYVRCGWVSQRVAPGASLEETVVPKAMTTYENPLADRQREEGPLGTWAGQPGSGVLGAPDIEAGRSLMPPLPSVPVDRMLRRAAERIGGKANRAQIMRWLADNVIDPNDPRNAPLLELLKTHEAASGALGDLFRLDIFPDVAMKDDRVADKRMSVLARRWQAGIYRAPDKNLLKGVRSVPLRAPLTAEETQHLDSQYLDQLALLEEAADGTQLGLARVMMARHEKAMQVQIGARLTNAIKEREERIRAFAIRVRAAAARLAGGRTMARRFRTEDVVNDAPLPQFKLELGAIAQLLAPRRPLKRSKKLVKSLMASVPRETQLMVTIQRAANLPARMANSAVGGTDDKRLRRGAGVDRRRGGRSGGDDGDEGGGGGLPSGAPDRLSQQRNCFVEVRFRSLSQRTIAVPGEFPIFNEEIDLDVFRDDGRDTQQAGPEDGSALEPSPSALQENSDLITFNVFDEIIVEPSEPLTLRRRDAEISDPVRLPERERRFLGCVRVPLSAIYQMQVLEGTFKLESPPVVLGYVQTSQRPATISIYMTLRPRLAAPAGDMDERVTSGEQEQVNRHAQRWRAALLGRAECRSRVVKVMAVDADGAAVLVCRYVAATLLPPSLAVNVAAGGAAVAAGGVEMLMLKLARFVAHVPYMEDSGLHKRRNDIWTSSAELLHLSGGDFEEHAHLLAGYFLQLGLQAFVVAGTSLCGARSMFVLTTGQAAAPPGQPQAPPPPLNLNAELLRLWNPLTGTVVSVKDPTGEMREVGQLYDGTNIWANTQPTGRPWEMHWNLTNGRDWAPFFGAQLPPREIATIQTTPLYEELEKQFYEELEGRVEKKVEEALSQARAAGAYVTKPDNKVSRLLKNLLREMPKTCEAIAAASLAASAALAEAAGKGPLEAPQHLGERHNLITGLQASHNERIRRESKAEAVHGHILALPFSDSYLEAVADAVLNTGIHRIADERVKFSTAVFVEPLGASFVCCMWIYVAAIRS